MTQLQSGVGAVVIGRNEGDRLVRCLESLSGRVEAIVYVDSGSSDGSPERARRLGAEVVSLDSSRPFTAARARNRGFEHLLEQHPGLRFVQFVDGDCEVREGWLRGAREHLEAHPDVAIVCGRRRERHPDASPYNRLVDMEWDGPTGEVSTCGGDALVRIEAFRRVGGYDASLIAGEEPELCLRLRRHGSRIVRLPLEMTFHDADLQHLRQWWRRCARAGHAYAEGFYLHGSGPERYRRRELASILGWGLGLPLIALVGTPATGGLSLLLLATYAILAARIRARRLEAGDPPRDAGMYAAFCVLGKFAEVGGTLRFAANRLLRGRSTGLIEYKGSGARRAS